MGSEMCIRDSTVSVLENGMVLHDWEWNDTARQLSSKYGLSVTEGGYPSEGLIAQDVEAIYPDAVVVDADGYLVIDIPMLAEQDELIAKIVMEGGAEAVQYITAPMFDDKIDFSHDPPLESKAPITFMEEKFAPLNESLTPYMKAHRPRVLEMVLPHALEGTAVPLPPATEPGVPPIEE